jgi:hypothetical protein
VISIRLEDPDGAKLPAARPGQYLTLRLQPDGRAAVGAPQLLALRAARRRLLPDHRQARARRRRERLPAHPPGLGDSSTIAAPARHLHPRPDPTAPVLLISAGIGATPVLAMLHALAAEHSDARSGGCTAHATAASTRSPPRPARSSPRSQRPQPRLLQPPRARRPLEGRDFDAPAVSPARCSPSSSPTATPRHTSAGRRRSWTRSAPAWRRSASTPRASTPSRSARRRADAGIAAAPARTPHPPAGQPGTARRSSSPAATSRSRGAATTRACSSSPRPATCPSAGRAAPASATPARRRSSPARRLQPRPGRASRRRKRAHLLRAAARDVVLDL